jgi:hypothetical protein
MRGSLKYCSVSQAAFESASDRWAPIDLPDKRHKSVYSFSEAHGELYIPVCREAVEDVSEWTLFALQGEQGYRSIAFPENQQFQQRLRSRVWNVGDGDLSALVNEHCVNRALFQIEWGPGSWTLWPGSVDLSHLLRLADPVVARINTELTE